MSGWGELERGDVLHFPGDRADICVVTTAPRPHGEVAFLRNDDDWPWGGPMPDYIDAAGWATPCFERPMVRCGMRLSERHTAMLEARMIAAVERLP